METHRAVSAFLAARASRRRRLCLGALEPNLNAGEAPRGRPAKHGPQTEPAPATAKHALRWLVVACLGSLPRLAAPPAGDGDGGSRSSCHGNAGRVAIALSAGGAPGGAQGDAERAQKAVRG